mmetsp:Transcript_11282/g.16435  ORF Transcript_11282/g.16435 Transcript_11282/m.16435 type:complete len:80 (-) Transcript_11282:278-517(-)
MERLETQKREEVSSDLYDPVEHNVQCALLVYLVWIQRPKNKSHNAEYAEPRDFNRHHPLRERGSCARLVGDPSDRRLLP